MKTNKIFIGILIVVVLFTTVAFTFPYQNGIEAGWDCFGFVCFADPSFWPIDYWCSNYCQQVPWGYWRCLGEEGCMICGK